MTKVSLCVTTELLWCYLINFFSHFIVTYYLRIIIYSLSYFFFDSISTPYTFLVGLYFNCWRVTLCNCGKWCNLSTRWHVVFIKTIQYYETICNNHPQHRIGHGHVSVSTGLELEILWFSTHTDFVEPKEIDVWLKKEKWLGM